jgi:N-acetyl-alpha-D-muramate 1-phosphate uridylyltransferase
MKIAILAGGLGTRLGSLTKDTPKSMVRIRGKPFLEYQLELLKRNNLEEIVLCVGHLEDEIESYFGTGSRFGVRIEYSEEEKPLGTAGALRNAENLLGDDFLVLNGDTYLAINYGEVIDKYELSNKSGLMVVYKNRNKYDKSNVIVNNSLVVEYNRSIQSPDMVYIDCGLSVLDKKALVFIPSGEFFQLDSVYSELIRRQELAVFEIKTRFYEIGSKSGLKDFKRLVEKKWF